MWQILEIGRFDGTALESYRRLVRVLEDSQLHLRLWQLVSTPLEPIHAA